MTYNGKGSLQYNLSSQYLKAGGEGEIYDIIGQSGLVAKIYKPGKVSSDKERKLIRMVNFPPDKDVLSQIAWPQDVLYNAGKFVGFVMPKMNINEDLNVIYEYGSSAKYHNMQWENRIIIAKNLCVVLQHIHNSGYVCGDLNPKNISVDPKTGIVVFLDTDSYHIEDGNNIYRCDVGIPEYLPIEIQRKMRGGSNLATAALPTFSKDTDNFALAIHIFQLLMNGVHPFACAIITSQSSVTAPQPSDNIERGEFPFIHNKSGIKIPVFAPKITILPKDMQDLFKRAFIDGHNSPSVRPKPNEWYTALNSLTQELKACKKIAHHQYYKSLLSCPWCNVDKSYNEILNNALASTQTVIKPPFAPPKPQVKPPKTITPASVTAKKIIFIVIFFALLISFIGLIFYSTRQKNIDDTMIEQAQIDSNFAFVTEAVNFRKTPEVRDDNIITQIVANAKVELFEILDNSWVKIIHNGTEGYVYGDYLKIIPSEVPGLYVGNTYQGNKNLKDAVIWIRRNAKDGGNYTIVLGKDETINNANFSFKNLNVRITIKTASTEHSVKYSVTKPSYPLITVGPGVNFILEDGVNLIGLQKDSSRLVRVQGGTFTMSGGSIIDSIDGGGVIVEDKGTFIMNNGLISGNSRKDDIAGSGGVQINNGTFTMNNGTIRWNSTTNHGGGVGLSSGTFTMNDGIITDNSSNGCGGGVYIGNGDFIMNNGTIRANKSRISSGDYHPGGGGVYISQGTFTMNNGTINENTSNYLGGGVNIHQGTFTMNNGSINGNLTERSGGGVCVVEKGTFTMNDGIISGNSANIFGGGVCIDYGGTFTKSNKSGIIYGSNAPAGQANRAPDNSKGHAVFFNDSSARIRNTTAGTNQGMNTGQRGTAGGWQ